MKDMQAVEKVFRELQRAEIKHPGWPDTDVVHGAAIVGEKAGKLLQAANQAANEYHFCGSSDKQKIIIEAAQTAAVAIRFLMHLEE